MVKKPYRKYSNEFKQQAVQLSYQLGPTRAAKQLGIAESNLSNWRDKKVKDAKDPKRQEAESQEDEIKRLRKENEELKKVNYILKRAAAFFSQDHLK